MSLTFFCIIKFSVPPITEGRNVFLSMEVLSSLELAFFQPWFIEDTFHASLQVEIMQEPLPNCLPSLIFPQWLCALMASYSKHSCTSQFFHDRIFPSPVLQPNSFITWQSCHPDPMCKFDTAIIIIAIIIIMMLAYTYINKKGK